VLKCRGTSAAAPQVEGVHATALDETGRVEEGTMKRGTQLRDSSSSSPRPTEDDLANGCSNAARGWLGE